jgi:hypothetical protein
MASRANAHAKFTRQLAVRNLPKDRFERTQYIQLALRVGMLNLCN